MISYYLKLCKYSDKYSIINKKAHQINPSNFVIELALMESTISM